MVWVTKIYWWKYTQKGHVLFIFTAEINPLFLHRQDNWLDEPSIDTDDVGSKNNIERVEISTINLDVS